MDDARILNIPNLGYNPSGISLGYHNPGGTTVGYIKTLRIVKGAVPLYMINFLPLVNWKPQELNLM